MGVEPTQDESIAPQTVLKTAAVTGPRAAPLRILPRERASGHAAGAGARGHRRRSTPHSSSTAPWRLQRTRSHATTMIASTTTAAMMAIVVPAMPPSESPATAAFGFRFR